MTMDSLLDVLRTIVLPFWTTSNDSDLKRLFESLRSDDILAAVSVCAVIAV